MPTAKRSQFLYNSRLAAREWYRYRHQRHAVNRLIARLTGLYNSAALIDMASGQVLVPMDTLLDDITLRQLPYTDLVRIAVYPEYSLEIAKLARKVFRKPKPVT